MVYSEVAEGCRDQVEGMRVLEGAVMATGVEAVVFTTFGGAPCGGRSG